MTDPMSPDPTLTFERGDRRHDDTGTTDPAVRAAAQSLDKALDGLLAAARIVSDLAPDAGGPCSPLLKIALAQLGEDLEQFDRALARFRKV